MDRLMIGMFMFTQGHGTDLTKPLAFVAMYSTNATKIYLNEKRKKSKYERNNIHIIE